MSSNGEFNHFISTLSHSRKMRTVGNHPIGTQVKRQFANILRYKNHFLSKGVC